MKKKIEQSIETIKTQWHPPFCSAMRLEFRVNKEDLNYNQEYNLNSKPIQIDLLIIKKTRDVIIDNEIGKLFREHNVMEYKSPNDSMDVDTYFKALAYAFLYKASAKTVNGIPIEEVTISLVREGKPAKLMKWFSDNKYKVEKTYQGIYYIKKDGFPLTQVIVTKELDSNSHSWLKALTRNMDEHVAKKLIVEMQTLSEKDEKEYADSVLELAMKENESLFKKMKGDDPMVNRALYELMKPEIDEKIREGIDLKQKKIVANLKKMNYSDKTIADIIEIPVGEVRRIIQENTIISKKS